MRLLSSWQRNIIGHLSSNKPWLIPTAMPCRSKWLPRRDRGNAKSRGDPRFSAGSTEKGGTMKKLINRPEDVVKEELAGMAAAHADLIRVDIEQQVIVRKDAPVQGKVGVISGGGSGNEPMHGGFVGRGMLDAACPGAVFTSPVPDQM